MLRTTRAEARRLAALLLIGVGTLALLARVDRLPPHTPQKFARAVSGLPLPRGATVLRWRSDRGDGAPRGRRRRVVLQLSAEEYAAVVAAAPARGYRRLPPAAPSRIGAWATRGWYRTRGGPAGTQAVVVLDDVRRRVVVLYQEL